MKIIYLFSFIAGYADILYVLTYLSADFGKLLKNIPKHLLLYSKMFKNKMRIKRKTFWSFLKQTKIAIDPAFRTNNNKTN